MKIIKKYRALLIIALVVAAGISFLFYHFYHNDVKALEDFLVSYEKFDKAISDFSINKTDDLESKAGDTLIEVNDPAASRGASRAQLQSQLRRPLL